MTDSVNAQLVNTINVGQQATMTPAVIKASGAGKAYQSVAQSTAIAIQDAADALRNASVVSLTASGVAVAQMLAQGDPESKYSDAIPRPTTY